MTSSKFIKYVTTGYDITQEGDALHINGVSALPKEIDYSDEESVKMLATNAVHTADGLYELIKNNCNTSEPDTSSKAHLEMYFALAGLVCEIYMKSIVYNEMLHEGKKCKGHGLCSLFVKIPDVHRKAIRLRIDNIDEKLATAENAFETLRYDFELGLIEGDFFVLFDLMEELKKICESYPKHTTGALICANGTLLLS